MEAAAAGAHRGGVADDVRLQLQRLHAAEGLQRQLPAPA